MEIKSQIEITKTNQDGVPVTIYARSKAPVYHWMFDCNYVLDFSTIKYKSRIPLDDSHGQEIGYGRIYMSDYGIMTKGVLSKKKIDNANNLNRILWNLESEIPQEASISFDCNVADLELIPAGASYTVNGVQIDGECIIVHNAIIKAVAICKHGTDSDTQAILDDTEPNLTTQIDNNIGDNMGIRILNNDEQNQAIDKSKIKHVNCSQTDDNKPIETEAKTEAPKAEEVKAEVEKVEDKPEETKTEAPKEAEEVKELKVDNSAKITELETKLSDALNQIDILKKAGVTPIAMDCAESQNNKTAYEIFCSLTGGEKSAYYVKNKQEINNTRK